MHIRLLYDLVALLLRLGTGVVFMAHGWQKIQVGVTATASDFSAMGVPAPTASAIYATFTELLGGAALVLGIGLPAAGLLLFLEMAGTFALIHAGDGLSIADRGRAAGGRELVLVLGLVALFMAVGGAGRLTLDRRLFGRDRGDRSDIDDDDFWGDGTPIGMGVGVANEADATSDAERAPGTAERAEGRKVPFIRRRKRPAEPDVPAEAAADPPAGTTTGGPATSTTTGAMKGAANRAAKEAGTGAVKADTTAPGGKSTGRTPGSASGTSVPTGRKPATGAKSTKREAKPRLAAEIAGDSAGDDPPDILVADRKGRAVRRPPASGTGPAGTSSARDTGPGGST